jgi:hypothetical protein
MNRFTPGVPAILILSAWSLAALADGAPTAAAPATAQATSAASASPAAAQTKTPATSAAAGNNSSVQRLVCLNMSLQCFSMKPKSEDAAAKTQTASLDLKAPDIRSLVPEVQLRDSSTDEETLEVQQVQVEGTRPEVYVPGGIASLPWAVMHPTQAWRIFLPVPPGTAK